MRFGKLSSSEKQDRLIKLWEEGLDVVQISERMGLCKDAIWKRLRKAGIEHERRVNALPVLEEGKQGRTLAMFSERDKDDGFT